MGEHDGLAATPVLEKNLYAVFGRDRVVGVHKGSGVASASSSGGSRGIGQNSAASPNASSSDAALARYRPGIFAIMAEIPALIAKPPKISQPNNSAASASGLKPPGRITEAGRL